MKVIDLLNKIANGEEMPKRVLKEDSLGDKEEYRYNQYWYIHVYTNPDGEEDYYYMSRNINDLNDEVEIIEEDKKIEKLDNRILMHRRIEDLGTPLEEMLNKINEIIDILNKGE